MEKREILCQRTYTLYPLMCIYSLDSPGTIIFSIPLHTSREGEGREITGLQILKVCSKTLIFASLLLGILDDSSSSNDGSSLV